MRCGAGVHYNSTGLYLIRGQEAGVSLLPVLLELISAKILTIASDHS